MPLTKKEWLALEKRLMSFAILPLTRRFGRAADTSAAA